MRPSTIVLWSLIAAGGIAVAWVKAAGEGFWKGLGERLGSQAGDELIEWAPRVAEALIRAGARLFIPSSHRQRYTDEWLAHLDDFRAEHDTALATIGCAVAIVLKGATRTIAPRTAGSDQPAPGRQRPQETARTRTILESAVPADAVAGVADGAAAVTIWRRIRRAGSNRR